MPAIEPATGAAIEAVALPEGVVFVTHVVDPVVVGVPEAVSVIV